MPDAFRIQGYVGVDTRASTQALGQLGRTAAGTAKEIVSPFRNLIKEAQAGAQALARFRGELEKTNAEGKKGQGGGGGGGLLGWLSGNQLLGQLQGLSQGLFSATKQWQTFRATLTAVTKDAAEADSILRSLTEYANTTPWDLPEVVQAAVKFKAMGLEMQRNLDLAGTLAATFGTDLTTAVDAVSKTLTGSSEGVEMLRNRFAFSRQEMQRFGVVMDGMGQVILRGSNDIAKMQKALEAFAQEKGGDAIALRAKTIEAAWSNLTGKIFEVAAVTGEKLAPDLIKLIDKMSEAVDWIKTWDVSTLKLVGGLVLLGGAIGTIGTALAPLLVTLASLKGLFAGAAIAAAPAAAEVTAVGTAATGAAAGITTLGLVSAGVFFVGFLAAVAAGVKALIDLRGELEKDTNYFGLLKEQAEGAADAIAAVNRAKAGGPAATGAQQAQAAVGQTATLGEQLNRGDLGEVLKTLTDLAETARQAREGARSGNLSPQEQKSAAQAISSFVDASKTVREFLKNVPASSAKPFENVLGRADVLEKVGIKFFQQAAQKQSGPAPFVGPLDTRVQRSFVEIGKSFDEIEHQEKIGQITRQVAAERRKALLEEANANRDRGTNLQTVYKLEEAVHQDRIKNHAVRMQNIKDEQSLLAAQGKLTPEAELGFLKRQRQAVEEAKKAGTISQDEARKQQQEIAVGEAEASRKAIEAHRDRAVEVARLAGGETAARIAELDKMTAEMRQQGYSEVQIQQKRSAELRKIWADEAQVRIDSEEDVAQRIAAARQKVRDQEIARLQDRKSQGQDVGGELAEARTQAAREDANDLRRSRQAEINKLLAQRNSLAPGDPERKRIDARVAAIRKTTPQEAGAIEDAARLENEQEAREDQQRNTAAGVQKMRIQKDALGLRQSRLEEAVQLGTSGAGAALLANLEAQYALEQKILEAERDREKFGKNAAEQANIEAKYAQDSYQAKVNAVKALTEANKLIEDQKAKEKMDRAQTGGGFDFTMGGITSGDTKDVLASVFGSGPDTGSGSYAAWLAKRGASKAADADKKYRARFGVPKPGDISATLPGMDGPFGPTGGTPPFVPWPEDRGGKDGGPAPVPVEVVARVELVDPDGNVQKQDAKPSKGNTSQQMAVTTFTTPLNRFS